MNYAEIKFEKNKLKKEWNNINKDNNEMFFVVSLFMSAVVCAFTLILSNNNWLFALVTFAITMTFMIIGMKKVHTRLESEFVMEELNKLNQK